jgi:hypothetical protein
MSPRLARFPRLAALALAFAVSLAGCAMDASTDAPSATPPVTNAACFGPDGTAQKYAVTQDAVLDLNGLWDRCSNTTTDIPADAVGVEFDGKFAYFLVNGPNGLTRSTSDAYTRAVQLRVESNGIVLVLAASDGTFSTYSAELTSAPRRLRLKSTTNDGSVTLGGRKP